MESYWAEMTKIIENCEKFKGSEIDFYYKSKIILEKMIKIGMAVKKYETDKDGQFVFEKSQIIPDLQ